MKRDVIIVITFVSLIWIAAAAVFFRQKKNKVSSFKEVKTQTLEEVEIKKISERLPSGLYEVRVNDSLTVLVYSESRGNSMIRVK